MRSPTFLLCGVLGVGACATSPAPPAESPTATRERPALELPTLQDRPVLTVPIAEAAPPMRRLWEIAQSAVAAAVPPPPEGNVRAHSEWVLQVWRPVFEAESRNLPEAIALVQQWRTERDTQSLYSSSLMLSEYYRALAALMQQTIPAHPEAAEVFRETVLERMGPLVVAREATLRWCVDNANSSPELGAMWQGHCQSQLEELQPTLERLQQAQEQREERRVQAAIEQARPQWTEACAAVPAPTTAPVRGPAPQTAWLSPNIDNSWAPLSPEQSQELARRAQHRIAEVLGLAELPTEEVATVEALRSQGRIEERGRRCAWVPPTEELLQQRYPDLTVGHLAVSEAGIDIFFSHSLDARFRGEPPNDGQAPFAQMLAAVEVLENRSGFGFAGTRPLLKVGGASAEDLRATEVLEAHRAGLRDCLGPWAVGFDATLRLSRSGEVQSVSISDPSSTTEQNIEVPLGAQTNQCLEALLRQTSWPCPPERQVQLSVCLPLLPAGQRNAAP